MPAQDPIKPLNWTPEPGVGYTVTRRADGGMHFVFSDANPKTLEHWRKFSLEHLYDSDRLTRNLYDLTQITEMPDTAVRYAVEVNNDPSVRNIRLAIVATAEPVRAALRKVADLTGSSSVDMGLFWTVEEAEAWLSRPLTLLV